MLSQAHSRATHHHKTQSTTLAHTHTHTHCGALDAALQLRFPTTAFLPVRRFSARHDVLGPAASIPKKKKGKKMHLPTAEVKTCRPEPGRAEQQTCVVISSSQCCPLRPRHGTDRILQHHKLQVAKNFVAESNCVRKNNNPTTSTQISLHRVQSYFTVCACACIQTLQVSVLQVE